MLDRFTGQWLITEHLRNTGAVQFWRGVVVMPTPTGKYQERIVNGEVHQRFQSAVRRPTALAAAHARVHAALARQQRLSGTGP